MYSLLRRYTHGLAHNNFLKTCLVYRPKGDFSLTHGLGHGTLPLGLFREKKITM